MVPDSSLSQEKSLAQEECVYWALDDTSVRKRATDF